MRSVRTPFVALMFAIAVLAVAPSLQAAPAGPLPDTSGILTPWRLDPAAPCVRDSVLMVVRGFVATPCDSFLGAEAISPLFVRIRRQANVDRACFAPPSEFYPVPVALGRFAAGPHMGIVEVETIQMQSDGRSTRVAQQYRFDFLVGAVCEIPPPGPPPMPYVHTISTEPPRPRAGQPTSLVIKGAFNNGCGRVIGAAVLDPQHVEITLRPYALRDTACTLALQPWRQDFNLGPLPSGPHRTSITLHVLVRDSSHSTFRRETYYGSHEFFVYGGSDSIPSPTPGPLPYVQVIVVGRDEPCGPMLPCPGDSLLVRVDGVFPNDCFRLRGIQLIPSIVTTLLPPPPPIVRIIVDDGCCLGRPCFTAPPPWSASVKLRPMAAGAHHLAVELAQVCCSDTYPPGELHRTAVPFAVADSCPPACLSVDFAPGPSNLSPCNATVSRTGAAELTFLVRPTVALAGLQGEFRLHPPELEVTRIEAIGPAEGMFIDWTQTPEGARFALSSRRGAPIPPYPPTDSGTMFGGGWPVLRVTVAHPVSGGESPERTVLTSENILGSDVEGGAVRFCPPPPCVDADPRFLLGQALICGERGCDLNADGAQDVRDLVLMVRCVIEAGTCPPDADVRFDCDSDGAFAIADVNCCARHALQRPPCLGCPADTGQVRPAPGVAVSFGMPEVTEAGIALPVVIAGINGLGAAMLTLEAPLDRYDVIGFDASPPGDWITLHEVRDGRIVLGLVDVHDRRRLAFPIGSSFTLPLALRPGQPAGGEVTAVAGEFSGPDGVALGVDLGRPTQTLPGGAQVALGPSQPNPFSTETAFTLKLVESGDVVVGIYDLRGRAVAILHRAPLAPGAHVFRWDGRRSDRGAAPNGIYFYQATVGGKSLARKLIMMRGD